MEQSITNLSHLTLKPVPSTPAMMASSSVEPTFEGVKKTELVPGECGVELHQYAQVHT